jgi:hypothetical protein
METYAGRPIGKLASAVTSCSNCPAIECGKAATSHPNPRVSIDVQQRVCDACESEKEESLMETPAHVNERPTRDLYLPVTAFANLAIQRMMRPHWSRAPTRSFRFQHRVLAVQRTNPTSLTPACYPSIQCHPIVGIWDALEMHKNSWSKQSPLAIVCFPPRNQGCKSTWHILVVDDGGLTG